MRGLTLPGLALGIGLLAAMPAIAQQQNQNGVGGALDTLNRSVNPPSNSSGGQNAGDRGYSGSSQRDNNVPNYRNYSDRQLRDEADRLQDDQRALRNEMDRRHLQQ